MELFLDPRHHYAFEITALSSFVVLLLQVFGNGNICICQQQRLPECNQAERVVNQHWQENNFAKK